MKNINTYISESVEIETPDDWHKTVTLVTRDNVDCSTLSKEDYVKMMLEDLKEADKLYREENKQGDKDWYEQQLADERKHFTDYANKKWKTDKRRQQYIETAMKNLKLQPMESKISIVTVNAMHPGPMSFNPRINFDDLEESINRSFESIKDSDIFREAHGWKIKYEAQKNTMRMAFLPYVYFIVSDAKRKEIEDEEQRLADSIRDFYKDTKYWGD